MIPLLEVLDGGLQSTIQAGPRLGRRHLGVPGGGAADPVSLALANRLVGNAPRAGGVEATLTGLTVRVLRRVCVGIAGAPCPVRLGGAPRPHHEAFEAAAGETLRLGPTETGCRTYLAVAGGIAGEAAFGSISTDLSAGFGGLEGRTLRSGDVLEGPGGTAGAYAETPTALRQAFAHGWTLRAVAGPEAGVLGRADAAALHGEGWRVDPASSRMGVRLSGPALALDEAGLMDSVATLQGTVQLPPGGAPIVLGPDGGTTGGYPRVAQVVRADRHLVGQLRPGDPVRLLRWAPEDADAVLAAKTALLRGWLGAGFRL